MKTFLYILVLSFTLLLTSCEEVEVTTFKGNWKTEKFANGEYIDISIEKDGTFVWYRMINDSTYSKQIQGTWVNNNDTISLFSQDKGKVTLIIEQLTMDIMTVRENKNYSILTRSYNDPDNKFYEVLDLKGGVLYYIFIGLGGLLSIGVSILFIGGVVGLLSNFWSFIKKHI